MRSIVDHATASNCKDIRVDHIGINWRVDWRRRILCGAVTLTCTVRQATRLIKLDTDALDINSVALDDAAVKWNLSRWKLGAALQVDAGFTLPKEKVGEIFFSV